MTTCARCGATGHPGDDGKTYWAMNLEAANVNQQYRCQHIPDEEQMP